jgi:hypothetical protein
VFSADYFLFLSEEIKNLKNNKWKITPMNKTSKLIGFVVRKDAQPLLDLIERHLDTLSDMPTVQTYVEAYLQRKKQLPASSAGEKSL